MLNFILRGLQKVHGPSTVPPAKLSLYRMADAGFRQTLYQLHSWSAA